MKIGIIGYGNLGRGMEQASKVFADVELVGIFTRRDPQTIDSASPVYKLEDLLDFKNEIDVCLLAGGSATDLISQGPEILKNFNTVDCFDTHAKIPEYFKEMNKIGLENKTLALISTGWDPGLFSINRFIAESILPSGKTFTFWGKGVSQGHSDAVRRIEGVKDAVQYTIPNEEALSKIRSGEKLELTTRDKHIRVCYVVTDEERNQGFIEESIKTMPNYFDEYETTVYFISQEELNKNHKGMPHGGIVIRTGETSENMKQGYEFKLELDSNPEFTASVAMAYARAIYRAASEGRTGAVTVFDLPLSYLSLLNDDEIRKTYL